MQKSANLLFRYHSIGYQKQKNIKYNLTFVKFINPEARNR